MNEGTPFLRRAPPRRATSKKKGRQRCGRPLPVAAGGDGLVEDRANGGGGGSFRLGSGSNAAPRL